MSSPLLALAQGILQGGVDNRAKKKADELQQRALEQQDLAAELKLRSTPGVSLEPAGVRSALDVAASIANGATPAGVGGAPGGGTAPGKSVGEVTLGKRRVDVRYDEGQSPANVSKADKARQVVQWQQVTNPRTKAPFTASEAQLLADGKAKYGDFKPEPTDPVSVHQSNRLFDVQHPLKDPKSSDASWQVVQTDAGVMERNPKTGVTRYLKDPEGKQVMPKEQASIRKAVATNKRQLTAIDDAISKVTAHPTAVGLLRGISDNANQRLDPEGVEARAAVSDVGSLVLHDRSGAAISASEWPRLAPFIPKQTDNAKTVVKKLKRMKALLAEETDALAGPVSGTGVSSTPVTAAGTDRPQGKPLMLGGKQFILPE